MNKIWLYEKKISIHMQVLHSVMRANKYDGDNVQTLRKDILKPMGIVAVSKQEEECMKNPCQVLNGGCAEICYLDEYGRAACKCNAGKMLEENGRCVSEPKNRANCTANEFRCSTGSCIDYELTCDGVSRKSYEYVRLCCKNFINNSIRYNRYKIKRSKIIKSKRDSNNLRQSWVAP